MDIVLERLSVPLGLLENWSDEVLVLGQLLPTSLPNSRQPSDS